MYFSLGKVCRFQTHRRQKSVKISPREFSQAATRLCLKQIQTEMETFRLLLFPFLFFFSFLSPFRSDIFQMCERKADLTANCVSKIRPQRLVDVLKLTGSTRTATQSEDQRHLEECVVVIVTL